MEGWKRCTALLAAALLAIVLLGLAAEVWTILTVRVTLRGVKPRVTRGDSLMTARIILPIWASGTEWSTTESRSRS